MLVCSFGHCATGLRPPSPFIWAALSALDMVLIVAIMPLIAALFMILLLLRLHAAFADGFDISIVAHLPPIAPVFDISIVAVFIIVLIGLLVDFIAYFMIGLNNNNSNNNNSNVY